MKHTILALVLMLLAAPVWADAAATRFVNDLRASKGRPALAYSQKLEKAALAHANDMAARGFFSHKGSNGSNVAKRVRRAGYKWCFAAENIAQGQKSLNTVLNAWAGSRGHYKNMISPKAREFGIARGNGNNWVMVVARRC